MNIYDNFFKWRFEDLIFMLLPPVLRQSKMLAWLIALSEGLNLVQKDLLAFRKQNQYDLLFSQERIVFEHYINDLFDDVTRSIRLENGDFLNQIMLFRHVENRSIKVYKHSEDKPLMNLYKIEEFAVEIHFKILVPSVLNLTNQQILKLRQFVDSHKLPDKNYIIQIL